jgi:hypothetical protein
LSTIRHTGGADASGSLVMTCSTSRPNGSIRGRGFDAIEQIGVVDVAGCDASVPPRRVAQRAS